MNYEASTKPEQNRPIRPALTVQQPALRFAKTPRVWFAFAGLMVILDYLSGPSLHLSPLFLVPVVVAAWHRRLGWAFAFAIALPLCRFWFEWHWGAPWSLSDAVGNCLVRVSVLVGFAIVTSRLAGAERRLRDSERLYQSLVQNIPQGIFRKDEAGRFTFANRRFCEHLGKPLAEVIGKVDEELFPPDLSAKYRTDDRNIFETGSTLETVEERRPLRGKPVYTHVIKTPLRDAENQIEGIQGIYWDVTEQRLLQDQLRQAQKMEAVGQLAGGVAHNFNNILTSMLIGIELMLAENRLDAKAQTLLQNLKEGIERAARLTRQLLFFSRPSKMQTQALDLNKLVEKELALFRQIIGGQIILRFDSHNGPLEVEADEGMIGQVILNLVNNARDAMPQGGVVLITTARSQVNVDATNNNLEARAGHFAVLEVTDSGCGMDKATVERIFEPFFTTKEIGRGTGLGLSMVHGIVKQHRGWVEVKSQPGIGSVFRVYLPSSTGTISCETEKEITAPPLQGTETILLVDDEISVREAVGKLLQKLGYKVLEAGSAREAEVVWKRHAVEIKLLFSDVIMPGGINGLKLAERLHAGNRDLRIILWSGYCADLEQQHEAASFSNITCLSKPCPPEEIARAIRKCLDEKLTSQTSVEP